MPNPEQEPLSERRSQEEKEGQSLSLLDFAPPRTGGDNKAIESKVLAEIKTHGKDGAEALLNAIKHDRVVGVAEIHTSGSYPNSVLFLLTSIMPELKRAGITHIALEVNKRNHQSILNDVMKNGRLDPETGKGIAFNDDWIKMMEAAAACGIKLVAVDDNPDRSPVGNLTWKENQHRETFMANEIATIVNSNPNARVLWPVGATHLTRRTGAEGYKWAGQQLSENAKRNSWTMTTFLTDIGEPYLPFQFVNVNKPTVVNLKDAKTIGEMKLHRGSMIDPRMPDSKAADFDAILYVPWDQELKVAEKIHGSKSTKLLPLIERSIAAYGQFLPDRTLMLCQKALPLDEQLHGARSPQVAMRLMLMAKLCDLLGRDEESGRYRKRGHQLLSIDDGSR